MHRTELILLYDSVEEYPHFVYFDMRDQKYYQTSRGYKAPPFREKYWILLTLTLLLARVSESVFLAYYSLFGPFIGFLLDTAFAVLTVFIGKRIALAFQLDKAMVSSVRETSYEIQMSQDDLKEKANAILIGYQKNRNMVFAFVFISATLSVLTALISSGMLFAFACVAWTTTWPGIRYMSIGERKKWLIENFGDDFFT